MKTKKATTDKKRETELKRELKREFGSVIDTDFLNEDALALAGDDDNYYY